MAPEIGIAALKFFKLNFPTALKAKRYSPSFSTVVLQGYQLLQVVAPVKQTFPQYWNELYSGLQVSKWKEESYIFLFKI